MDTLVRDTIRALERQRSFWVELEGLGWSVQFRRPPESQLPSLMGGVTVEHVVSLAVGWKGVTPSKLLGPAGGSDELEFDRELWGEWVRDHVDHVSQCATEIARRITEHLEKRAASGNA